MWALLLSLLTVLVFGLPLVPAVLEWQRRRDIRPLAIDSEHTLDVAAVAAEFRAMIVMQTEPTRHGGAAHSIRSVNAVANVTGIWLPTGAEAASRVCKRTVLASGSLILPDSFTFTHEIYGPRGIRTGKKNHLQSVLSEGELAIGSGSELHRWAHARSAHIAAHCRLDGPLSATHTIRIDEGCHFAYLSAGVIGFGMHHLAESSAPRSVRPQNGETRTEAIPAHVQAAGEGRWLATRDLTISPQSMFQGDLVVHGDLWIGAGARIAGSVKASGSIRLGAEVRIDGALIAAGSMVLAKSCMVAGPVSAERELDIETLCVIGSAERPTTVVAPVMRVSVGAVVFGAACALEKGRVVSKGHIDSP